MFWLCQQETTTFVCVKRGIPFDSSVVLLSGRRARFRFGCFSRPRSLPKPPTKSVSLLQSVLLPGLCAGPLVLCRVFCCCGGFCCEGVLSSWVRASRLGGLCCVTMRVVTARLARSNVLPFFCFEMSRRVDDLFGVFKPHKKTSKKSLTEF